MDFEIEKYVNFDYVSTSSDSTASEGPLVNFARSAAYAGFQNPVNAFAQIGDELAPRLELSQRLHLVDAPAYAPFMSANWHAQQLGAAVGLVPLVVGLELGLDKVSQLTPYRSVAYEVLTNPIGRAAVAGGLYGGALTPGTGHGWDLLESRLKNTVVGSATFAATIGARESIGTSFGDSRFALTARGGLAGLAGGVVHRELSSLIDGNGLVVDRKLAESLYTFGALGATSGFVSSYTRQLKPDVPDPISPEEFEAAFLGAFQRAFKVESSKGAKE